MLKIFYLTLLIGPTLAAPAPQSVIEALTSVQITTSAGQASGFQLTFALSNKSQLNRVLIPSGYFDPKTRAIIVVTINGIPNVVMDGVITRHDIAPSNELGQSTFTVTGQDISLILDLEEKTEIYPAMPDIARVLRIISRAEYTVYGLLPKVIPPLSLNVTTPLEKIPTQTSTDLEYLKLLANDNGYVFYIEPGPAPGTNTAYWGPEIRAGAPQSALSINMDAHTNVESLSFSFDGLARKQLAIAIQEPTTKLGISIPLPDITLLRPPLAAKQAPALRIERLKDVAKENPIRAASLGLSRASESAEAVTGSGSLDVLRYGRILQARGVVGVRGAGTAYDGLYYVKSVTHNIKPGEYKQSFTLSRNGLISLTPKVPV
ncbi:hypothetical protein [Gloeocapsopsis dulcis]|uniref:Phage tail protein n=1 Tax=Gloeocapsopsis dulcis AAB1 = 1H9 TaxID=1433147 RepID=A0A6N8FRX7_9CHRO|nr:hypothetical protein [Gloeocapsopsis dulcis]MUL34947.1 hypothetical protein [Gloeocapsopsis dulcis AAB1 = 1H9]WNN89981.1 hypothetical protein P0S91_02465 [Gloeocapsopsis dulcis]